MSLSHAKISIFYRQLAQQLAAGLTFAQALRALSPAPAADSFRLAALAESGLSMAAVVAAAAEWLPAGDRPFLTAAARSGRLPLVLVNLADRHAQLDATQKRVVFACLYPLGVFHLGAFIYPFLRVIDFEKGLCWSPGAYLGVLLAILLPAWGGGALLGLLVRRRHPAALALLDSLPAIGGYRRNQALADFAFALGNLLEGGEPIEGAWLAAGEITQNPRLHSAAKEIAAHIRQGRAPGPHLAATNAFSPEFIARYQTGETTGNLETSLLALAADHQAIAQSRLLVASLVYPGLLFGGVALMIAYIVISFAMQYYGMIGRMIDGG